ncbi:hypothetical protein GJAV_G00082470 [Gymnothorax javanicus]|nr:hypothetical protein GJAV_G00082470 [Gymnothorax javanicus]
MASDLMLNFENHLNQRQTMMNNDTGGICIDQDGEWDLSLFDELEDIGDADELLQALEDAACVGEVPDLDLDLSFPPWNLDNCEETSSCTDGDMSAYGLSPNPTLHSVSSPGSVEALSPYSLSDELSSPQSQPLSPQSQASPGSMSPESLSSSEVLPGSEPQKRASQSRAKASQPLKRPVPLTPKHTASASSWMSSGLTTNCWHAAPAEPPDCAGPTHPAVHQPSCHHANTPQNAQGPPVAVTQPVVPATLSTTGVDGDTNVGRRQQRLIKNRESASLSRKKKKEYLLTLEARLKVALSENNKLKSENGSLKNQLEGLMTENNVLKATAPKRRAVCLLVVLVFLVMNVGPLRLLDGDTSSKLSAGTMNSGRHLLGFSPDTDNLNDQGTPETAIPQAPDGNEDAAPEKKALMVPSINRTKSIMMAHQLRGWVHRHEVERTKSRRMNNSQHKTKTILKSPDEKSEVAEILTVQYTDISEKSAGSEIQVYYAPHRSHYDFFEEIHRRGDTFYVVSFRRDHLLLPATNHNKRNRPKMSVLLPAMNINGNVIKDKEYETMMQIDCEVMDTRILHIKSSSIPSFLRVNHTDSFYQSGPVHGQATPPVGVLTGSA